jgi:succinate dehydrogenase/fumarate reductase iron-sulfur protein
MTCYIPKIENPEAIFTIKIRRFNPETDEKPCWKSYEVPFVKTMTVVEALEYLWDQSEYVAFRANCREFTCGSCAMLINDKPQLACNTLLEDDMTLEPLSRFPVIRDLVVDVESVKSKLKTLKYWPVAENRELKIEVAEKIMERFHEAFSPCVECGCCLDACSMSHSEQSKFDGPMYLLQIARAKLHPLDTMDRVQQASARGAWSCVNCFECADVCPVGLSPGEEITKLRREAVKKSFLNFLGIK